jgi:hypothetical protein
MISSVHGKTRPPPDETHQDEPTGDSLSRIDSGTTASSQHDVATSSIDPQLGADADWNAILDTEFWPQSTCQGQDWTSVEADSTQALGPGIEWTDWTGGDDLSMPTADDMEPAEAIENMQTSLTTLPATFTNVSTTQPQLSSGLFVPASEPSRSVNYPGRILVQPRLLDVVYLRLATELVQNPCRKYLGSLRASVLRASSHVSVSARRQPTTLEADLAGTDNASGAIHPSCCSGKSHTPRRTGESIANGCASCRDGNGHVYMLGGSTTAGLLVS